MKRPLVSILVISILGFGGLAATLAADNSPELGLDLQGGVAIVLEPDGPLESSDVLDQSIEILRNRVDALGVAEPEITRQGDTVIVQLPGVTDRARAREIVGKTAELRFRPVLGAVPANLEDFADLTTTTTEPDGEGGDEADSDDGDATTTTEGDSEETSLRSAELIAQTSDDSDEGGDATTTTVADDGETDGEGDAGGEGGEEPEFEIPGVTPPEEDLAENPVVLPELDEDGNPILLYSLGPAELTGSVVSTANARLAQQGGGWTVNVNFTSEGSPQWDAMASRYFGSQIAIVLDGVVISAPTIQAQEFGGTAVISGGEGGFSEGEAKDLALVLRFGALPVQLQELTVQEVSATLGRDALDAGVVAGLVGVFLVGLYVLAYYRMLGLVVIGSLSIAGMMLWTIIAYLGASRGLALTLAGTTGIIVSIGVAVDSNIVYYERIKEELRSGKSLRPAVDQAFNRSFSTIVKADVASLIGAGVLYMLTVGPVRGFALFLGLSTLLDLVVSYWFMRPAAILLSRSKRFGRPSWLGLPEVTQ